MDFSDFTRSLCQSLLQMKLYEAVDAEAINRTAICDIYHCIGSDICENLKGECLQTYADIDLHKHRPSR